MRTIVKSAVSTLVRIFSAVGYNPVEENKICVRNWVGKGKCFDGWGMGISPLIWFCAALLKAGEEIRAMCWEGGGEGRGGTDRCTKERKGCRNCMAWLKAKSFSWNLIRDICAVLPSLRLCVLSVSLLECNTAIFPSVSTQCRWAL